MRCRDCPNLLPIDSKTDRCAECIQKNRDRFYRSLRAYRRRKGRA